MTLRTALLTDLEIVDEGMFRGIGVWRDLHARLVRDRFPFRVADAPWQRVLFLNLTFWNAAEPSDVLVDDTIDADVVAHAAWHHAAGAALYPTEGRPSIDALFLAEAVASAFDVYLVGRLVGRGSCAFLESQVPAMADAAADAGCSDDAFEALIASAAEDPDRAFEDVRQLLFDAAEAVVDAGTVDRAADALAALTTRRWAPLLHHYELSNWVLYARAYGGARSDPRVAEVDRALRGAPSSVGWLHERWL